MKDESSRVTEEEINSLKEYAMLSNDSYGEACISLINLWYRRDHYSYMFCIYLDSEIFIQLKHFIDNFKIVETTETVKHRHRELECKISKT